MSVRSITGSELRVSTGDFHGHPFAVHGYFEWRNIVIAAAVAKPGDTIIEVGANVGTETVGFADVVGPSGRVVAIEPDDANVARIRELARRLPQVAVVHAVAAVVQGTRNFSSPPNAHETGTGHISDTGDVAVRAVTLDAVSTTTVSAIFSDTEGYEVEVLQGAERILTVDRPALVVEVNARHLARAGSSTAELASLLDRHGYRFHSIGRWGVVDTLPKSNWLAVPAERADLVRIIHGNLRAAFLLPPRLHPLVRDVRRRSRSAAVARQSVGEDE